MWWRLWLVRFFHKLLLIYWDFYSTNNNHLKGLQKMVSEIKKKKKIVAFLKLKVVVLVYAWEDQMKDHHKVFGSLDTQPRRIIAKNLFTLLCLLCLYVVLPSVRGINVNI